MRPAGRSALFGAMLLTASGALAQHRPDPSGTDTVARAHNEREDMVRKGEAELSRGDALAAHDWFERAGNLGHEADAELGQVRAMMQAGAYRQALAFAAHTAGVHAEDSGGAGLYAWLLYLGGQPRAARDVLQRARSRLPGDPLLTATVALLADPTLQPSGKLLDAPARYAPSSAASATLPTSPRLIASGVVIDAGTLVLTTSAALPAQADTLWVRDGLGRVSAASVEQLDETNGLAQLRLAAPFAGHGAPLTVVARDPFPGSPAFSIGYAPARIAQPAWPMLRIEFIGTPTGQAGIRTLGAPASTSAPGSVIFDRSGHLAGIVIGGSADRVAMPSVFARPPSGVSDPQPLAVGALLPLDEIYERALVRVVQVLSVP